MKTETLIWTIVFALGVMLLIVRGIVGGGLFGTQYAEVEKRHFVNLDGEWVDFDSPDILDHEVAEQNFEAIPDDRTITWEEHDTASVLDYLQAEQADPQQEKYVLSVWRTIGVWIAAFFTLAIFSFLYRDNPLYKIAEAVVVGVSAAYWMVVGFWDVIVPNLVGKLFPMVVKNWAMPGLAGEDLLTNLSYIVPLILGVMLLMRLAPAGGWISRWPLAFIIGTTAGIRLVGFIHADFLSQIRASIVPLVMHGDTGFDWWESLKNLVIVAGVLACLVYFFFSFEHKGLVGRTAKVGIWVLMITFGAGFGYTVMGRIALLAIRIEFLLDDWLWLIDPTGKRAVAMLFM